MDKQLHISKPSPIDTTMSLGEMKEYLKETVFSPENIAPSFEIINKKFLKYKRQYVNWELEEHDDELYKICSSLDYMGNHKIPLNIVPYWVDEYRLSKIYFCRFHYRNYDVLAHFIGGQVQLYSMHTVKRYMERFLNESNYKTPTTRMIGEMLIYNKESYLDTYQFDGRSYKYEIVRDGIFNCEYRDGSMIRTTFLSRDMLRISQVEFYNRNTPKLNVKMLAQGLPPIPRITDDSWYMAA